MTKIITSNVLFCPTNSLNQPENIQFTIIENQQIFTLKKLELTKKINNNTIGNSLTYSGYIIDLDLYWRNAILLLTNLSL